MDFTISEEFIVNRESENYSYSNSNAKSTMQSKVASNNIVSILSLINSNQDLIQDCLESKQDSVLSSKELKKYGSIALTTAALECKDEKEYRSFAKRRLEVMMNRAIAEAHLILELQGKICDSNKVGMEFASIEKTYC